MESIVYVEVLGYWPCFLIHLSSVLYAPGPGLMTLLGLSSPSKSVWGSTGFTVWGSNLFCFEAKAADYLITEMPSLSQSY